MKKFSEILKLIRSEASITQEEFADILGVSKFLIVKLETSNREPSRKFILDLSKALDINPISLTPFLFSLESENIKTLSTFEKKLIELGEKFQNQLLKKKAKLLST